MKVNGDDYPIYYGKEKSLKPPGRWGFIWSLIDWEYSGMKYDELRYNPTIRISFVPYTYWEDIPLGKYWEYQGNTNPEIRITPPQTWQLEIPYPVTGGSVTKVSPHDRCLRSAYFFGFNSNKTYTNRLYITWDHMNITRELIGAAMHKQLQGFNGGSWPFSSCTHRRRKRSLG